uniref:Uncharacterized protein n=1 Tax=Arundo donax TaxID=35708 RepID=A0A0A9GDN1_ARUDO
MASSGLVPFLPELLLLEAAINKWIPPRALTWTSL